MPKGILHPTGSAVFPFGAGNIKERVKSMKISTFQLSITGIKSIVLNRISRI